MKKRLSLDRRFFSIHKKGRWSVYEYPIILNTLEQVTVLEPWYEDPSSSEETPPTPVRQPWHKERQWRSRMPSSSPKNSKTTPTTKQHYRRTTKEEPHERSKSRIYLQKSSAAG